MRGLRAFLRQSFVMEFARGFGIAAEIELIFPSEIQTRLRKSALAERHTTDRVIGDAAENPASVMPINKLFAFSEDTHRGQRSASATKARAPIVRTDVQRRGGRQMHFRITRTATPPGPAATTGYLASPASANMLSPRSKTGGSGPSGFGSARHSPLRFRDARFEDATSAAARRLDCSDVDLSVLCWLRHVTSRSSRDNTSKLTGPPP